MHPRSEKGTKGSYICNCISTSVTAVLRFIDIQVQNALYMRQPS
jgi:hypothetical protein